MLICPSNIFLYFFRDIPSDITSFAITLYNKGKRSKDMEIGLCLFTKS